MSPALAAVGLYAGIMGLIAMWLMVVVSRWRVKTRVMIGDGGDPDLVRAMRGQANFVENVPLALVLFLFMAMAGAPAIAIHILGVALTAGRILHGIHFSAPNQPRWMRGAGASLSMLVLLAASLGAIGHAAVALF